MKPFINFFYTICMHLHFFFFDEKKQTPSLHRKLTWRDEIKDNYRDWLPFLVIIIVITVIVIALALISATEANVYYYGGLA